jgi:hypothetical protein
VWAAVSAAGLSRLSPDPLEFLLGDRPEAILDRVVRGEVVEGLFRAHTVSALISDDRLEPTRVPGVHDLGKRGGREERAVSFALLDVSDGVTFLVEFVVTPQVLFGVVPPDIGSHPGNIGRYGQSWARSWLTTTAAVLAGMANPRPTLPLLSPVVAIATLMPTTRPAVSTSAPPELP